jgi:hypothetical protein
LQFAGGSQSIQDWQIGSPISTAQLGGLEGEQNPQEPDTESATPGQKKRLSLSGLKRAAADRKAK